jgi:capsular polysaccharide transport system permease protein
VEASSTTLPQTAVPAALQPQPAKRRQLRNLLPFLLIVALPTVLALVYLWLFAADRYQSEARFVLRQPGQNLLNNPALSELMQVAGVSRSGDDGFVVQEFLLSRAAMQRVQKTANFRESLAPAAHDPLWRFPSLFSSNSDEGLFGHYERLVSADFDSTTGVSSLTVQAFSPADARRLANALLDEAEALVNRLNERARRDAISLAEAEVDRMKARMQASQEALVAFRERERLIDPGQATFAILETIARLSGDAADVSVQLNELRQGSPKAPQATSLRNRRAALEAQIEAERRQLAGDAKAIAPRIAEYERLMLEREFANRALLASMAAAETARVDAQRQLVYLERVAEPSYPDYPAFPYRIIWSFVVLAASYLTYRIWLIIAADVRRHAEI